MEHLAFENYKSFIDAAECVRAASAACGQMEAAVRRVTGQQLPRVEAQCRRFGAHASALVAQREANRGALACVAARARNRARRRLTQRQCGAMGANGGQWATGRTAR